jgi:hypothetical protein
MIEPRKVDVAYADGRWLAEVPPDYDEPLDCVSLQQIIDIAQRDWSDRPLISVVDQPTVEGDDHAVAQFFEVSKKSGAMVIIRSDL